jgi:methyl-accepting chemotaxis protein
MENIFSFSLLFGVICSVGGVIVFLYSLTIIKKIKNLFPKSEIIKKWRILQALIFIFLLGYLVNIIALFLELDVLIIYMTSIVYLFGAIFVLLIINLTYKTYRTIIME